MAALMSRVGASSCPYPEHERAAASAARAATRVTTPTRWKRATKFTAEPPARPDRTHLNHPVPTPSAPSSQAVVVVQGRPPLRPAFHCPGERFRPACGATTACLRANRSRCQTRNAHSTTIVRPVGRAIKWEPGAKPVQPAEILRARQFGRARFFWERGYR